MYEFGFQKKKKKEWRLIVQANKGQDILEN